MANQITQIDNSDPYLYNFNTEVRLILEAVVARTVEESLRESLTEEPSQEQEELKDILHELREDLDPEILNNDTYFFFSALLKVTALCPSWERDSDYLLSNYVKRNERPEKKTGIREAHISFSRIFSVINIHVLVNRPLDLEYKLYLITFYR